jgi:murein tripeptide amidase MpaA
MSGVAGFRMGVMAARPRRVGFVVACIVAAGLVQRRAPEPERERRVAVRFVPQTAADLERAIDVWSDDAAIGRPVDAVVSAAELGALPGPVEILVDDIDAVAAAERVRLAARTADAGDWFAEYRDVDEVYDYLDRLAARHPEATSLYQIGTSLEGQPIRALEISRGGDIAIALNGGQHAREWIGVMVPTCIADRLIHDPDADRVLERVRFTIVPIVNPDGYRYSWTDDRYWRKNRRGGYGVDLNRNYAVGWGGRASSDKKRSEIYRGEHPFSEPESSAMRDLFATRRFAAHVDFHSYSQLILYPWSHSRTPPPDRARFARIADAMSAAMYAAHGKDYRVIAGSELGLGAAGTFTDFTYGEHGAMSYVVELRPKRGGFVLPPEHIRPTCDESFAAVLALAEATIAATDTR